MNFSKLASLSHYFSEFAEAAVACSVLWLNIYFIIIKEDTHTTLIPLGWYITVQKTLLVYVLRCIHEDIHNVQFMKPKTPKKNCHVLHIVIMGCLLKKQIPMKD